MARTRRRITEAAIELHGSVGPAATTMTAIAERAGVTRATLYRHFANEAEVFSACSGTWLAANPRPDTGSWSRLRNPEERIGVALREMYAYYRSTEDMLANLFRDVAVLPDPAARNLASYPTELLAALDEGWSPDADPRIRRAAILVAVSFETWRSLAREGLSDDEAADLMSGLVLVGAAAGRARREGGG